MTNQVRTYEYRDLSSKKSTGPAVREHKDSSFEVHPEQKVTEVSAKKDLHFRVDQTVASQLGLEDKEKKQFDQRVQKEIERRWELQSEQAEAKGYEKGLEEGQTAAYKAEMPRIMERLQRFDQFMQEMDKMREKIFLANEAFLMDLFGQVAKMVILKEVAIDKEYLHRVVLSLLHQLGTKEDIKIFISPEDYANVDTLAQAIQKEFGKLSNTQIDAVVEIPVGGCKVETRFGVMDASVETQIQNVMKALKG